ncbi:hypothetical protein CAPTEDRAFT_202165 [Capitella teleta]|uniref:G-protein coupled receptors family 1 profile domain-containing protein n=1 Tax=Capitella teleta TaxID=283909 RepID=R7U471_CAPTE|nr:hypothetical protein CAPTEDRAFT_202165 [Capitella teleta]|eukprot:ELU00769.1 hypothetical protein CAPTEDRAFT_202165 [Capitella teleta]
MDSTTVVADTVTYSTDLVSEYWRSTVFESVVVFLGACGAIGNCIVFLVFIRMTNANTFLMNQAAIDACAGSWLVVTYVYRLTVPKHHVFEVSSTGFAACLLLDGELPLWCSLNASVYGLLAITLERYVKIVLPNSHRTSSLSLPGLKVPFMIVLTWLWPFSFTCAFTVPFSKVGAGKCLIQMHWPSEELHEAYGTIKLLLFFILPVLIIVVAYSHMLYVLKNNRSKVSPALHSVQNIVIPLAQVNLTKVMMWVTATFLLCWIPSNVYYLLYNFGLNNLGFSHPLYFQFLILVYFTCCINPVIYACRMTDFRAALLAACRSDSS